MRLTSGIKSFKKYVVVIKRIVDCKNIVDKLYFVIVWHSYTHTLHSVPLDYRTKFFLNKSNNTLSINSGVSWLNKIP